MGKQAFADIQIAYGTPPKCASAEGSRKALGISEALFRVFLEGVGFLASFFLLKDVDWASGAPLAVIPGVQAFEMVQAHILLRFLTAEGLGTGLRGR